MKYIEKAPMIIEAERLSLENMERMLEWCNGRAWSPPPLRAIAGIEVMTVMGPCPARFGEWIALSPAGAFHVMSNETFESRFEPMPEPS